MTINTRISKRDDLPEPHRTTSKIIHWNRAELDLIFFGEPPTETGKLHTLNPAEKMELEKC